MDRAYFLYVQEIVNFLNNIVIKFNPFVNIFNQNATYLSVDGFDEYDKTTYPYYRILTGDTAFATTDIYGYSPNTRSEILLTKASILANPDIVTFYREPRNLKLLTDRYPNDDFLIRRIINPVTDIQAAISAKSLTILPTKFHDTYLNEYERDNLLIFLQEILWRIEYRWYISPLEFEDMYPYAFWGMLWNVLPILLLTKRILNLRTVNVHPFHIWEYLKSVGFEGYYGYLTRNQELFLYRNARYLKFHAGKKFLLDILESVFLIPLKYNLSKRDILSHTYNREDTHDKYPDVIPSSGGKLEYPSSVTFDSLLGDIYDDGYDTNNDLKYIKDITDRFIKSPVNKLSTKFLALDRNIDMSELMLLIKFILDETIYLNSTNKLSFVVNIQSPITQNIIQFDNVIDALSLFYYCIYVKDNPTIPFKKYTLTTALTHDTAPVIPPYVNVSEVDYFVQSYIDIPNILDDVPYINDMIFFSKDLSYKLGDLYIWLFAMINELKSISDQVQHEALNHVLRKLVPEKQVVTINQSYNTYTEYFERYPQVYEELSKITNDDQYGELMYSLISGICPLEYGFAALARDDEVVSVLIHKIKELFMYMVSYNITFLNPNIEQTINFDLPKLALHVDFGILGDDDSFTDVIGSLITIGNNNLQDTFNYFLSVNHISDKEIELDDLSLEYDIEQLDVSNQLNIESDNTEILQSISQQSTTIIYETFEGNCLTFLNHLG